MFQRSLKNTILLNIGAFLLVLILEILSIWTVKDKFETEFAFYLHGINYAIIIMLVIWFNHFILIPFSWISETLSSMSSYLLVVFF